MRVDPPLGRRMQTYPPAKRRRYSAIVAPDPHPLSSPLVTLPVAGLQIGISMPLVNLLLRNELKATPLKRPLQAGAPGTGKASALLRPAPAHDNLRISRPLQLFQQRCDASRHSAANRNTRTGQPGPSRAPGFRGAAGSAGRDSHRSGACRRSRDHRCRWEPPDRLCRWHRGGEHWASASRGGGRGSDASWSVLPTSAFRCQPTSPTSNWPNG